MSQYTAAVSPNRSLGIFTLGQSLYEITTRIKAEPKVFQRQCPYFDPDSPSTKPIILKLPDLGINLRFDGPEQRLRLIEVIDFTKNVLSYKDIEILPKPSSTSSPSTVLYGNDAPAGPAFKQIYKLFGPTFSGVYDPKSDLKEYGTYTLSYPGIAFNFPVQASAYNPSKDLQAILASPTTLPASSLAIFSGGNWPDVRKTIWAAQLEDLKVNSPGNKEKLAYPEEISMVHILGAGALRLDRAYSPTQSHFWTQLGKTTPQELVAELGPPDAIYRKSDQHLSIHKARAHSGNSESTTHSRHSGRISEDHPYGSHDDSSSQTGTGSGTPGESASDESDHEESDGESSGDDTGEAEEYFYNYYHHGLDFVISRPVASSQAPPSADLTLESSPETAGGSNSESSHGPNSGITSTSAPLVATKIVLHGNIPGTFSFGHWRRVRWRIQYLNQEDTGIAPAIGSETLYSVIASALQDEWKGVECSADEHRHRTKGMVFNQGWGESVGSSMEVLGTWEEGAHSRMETKLKPGKKERLASKAGMEPSILYSWPGLAFEVATGGAVSGLTAF